MRRPGRPAMRRPVRPVVYVFVRAPALGAVKTRLGAGIGALAAAHFYRHTTTALLRRIGRDRRWRTVLAVTPDTAIFSRGAWPASLPRIGQGNGDLGRRMARILAAERTVPALIIGSDIPDIAAGHIVRAFKALGSADVVFGPALDGGYWLVGRRAGLAMAGLFEGVRWSGPHALADTRANVRGVRGVALLETLEDIDDGAAFARWRAGQAPRPGFPPDAR